MYRIPFYTVVGYAAAIIGDVGVLRGEIPGNGRRKLRNSVRRREYPQHGRVFFFVIVATVASAITPEFAVDGLPPAVIVSESGLARLAFACRAAVP